MSCSISIHVSCAHIFANLTDKIKLQSYIFFIHTHTHVNPEHVASLFLKDSFYIILSIAYSRTYILEIRLQKECEIMIKMMWISFTFYLIRYGIYFYYDLFIIYIYILWSGEKKPREYNYLRKTLYITSFYLFFFQIMFIVILNEVFISNFIRFLQ